MPRPRIDNPETKARILAAAEMLFAERGAAGTSIREVAESAGVNTALVHYYFGSKEALHQSVFVAVATDVAAMAHAIQDGGGTATERLRRYVQGFARFVVTHPHRPQLILRDLVDGAPTLKKALASGLQPVHIRVLAAIVADGVATGEFRDVDVQLIPITILGMVAQFVVARPLFSVVVGPVDFDETFADRLGKHTATLLLDGILTRSEACEDES
jgi:TetR/AcrR family transcriptional regulator